MKLFRAQTPRDQAMVNCMASEVRLSGWCRVRLLSDEASEHVGMAMVQAIEGGISGVFQGRYGRLSVCVRWDETKEALGLYPLEVLTVVSCAMVEPPGRLQ